MLILDFLGPFGDLTEQSLGLPVNFGNFPFLSDLFLRDSVVVDGVEFDLLGNSSHLVLVDIHEPTLLLVRELERIFHFR